MEPFRRSHSRLPRDDPDTADVFDHRWHRVRVPRVCRDQVVHRPQKRNQAGDVDCRRAVVAVVNTAIRALTRFTGDVSPMTQTAYRAQLLTFRDDPAFSDDNAVHETDGLLLVEEGRVVAAGAYAALRDAIAPDAIVRDLRDKLIVPGFIDSHIHYPQTDMIASPAPGLLPWLNTYTFPTERKFEDPAYARETASFFIDELLACGTTTALVYCTVHKQSADAFFSESESRNLRMIAGKVLMDRNCRSICVTPLNRATTTVPNLSRAGTVAGGRNTR